jgi:hypothetical protein
MRKLNTFKFLPALFFISVGGGIAAKMSVADAVPAASVANPSVLILEHIANSVDQLSSQLVAMQGASQQNWENYFKLEADVKFSSQDYPNWQKIQGDFSTLQGGINPSALNTLLTNSSQSLFNPGLATYSTDLDQASLNLANGAINQVNQINQTAGAMAEVVALPLETSWQQELSTANQLDVLKAMSAQMSINNALMYNLWQQSQTQQLLLSRLLVELTQLNQSVNQLSSIAIHSNKSQ